MARSWRETASQQAEEVAGWLGELLSGLGVDVGAWPPWVGLSWVGLVLLLLLGLSARRGGPRRVSTPENVPDTIAPDPVKVETPDEPKKRNRRKAGEKKPQRNGLAVEPQAEVSSAVPAGPEPPDVKTEKAKKNKKKAKVPAKETKSSRPTERKEPDEAGNWETKVSNREKRQRRKDKGACDGSASPGGLEPVTMVPAAEQPVMGAEEAKTTPSNSSAKGSSSSDVVIPAGQGRVFTDCATAEVPRAVLPQVSPGWEAVLPVNGSSWRDVGVSLPPTAGVRANTWTNMTPPCERQESEPAVWPQEMEGSWTIVDGSHIPVSFPELSAAVEAQTVPSLSWICPSALDDEWSGLNSGSADTASDWSAPREEWGNYEARPPEGAVAPEAPTLAEVQESDTEKETTAPGSSKAKKKKKKKKRPEEAPPDSQVEGEVGVAKDHNTAGNVLPKTVKEESQTSRAAPGSAPPRAPTRSAVAPAQRKPEDSWESPKQVKKKARRET
ncbi:protein LYRIC [Brachyhypopomus gauderio]|uniref:protein LYRIC n=1 Tax=Brachyhypopomus gauderio TaxID=698409 RepID=UPI004042F859